MLLVVEIIVQMSVLTVRGVQTTSDFAILLLCEAGIN